MRLQQRIRNQRNNTKKRNGQVLLGVMCLVLACAFFSMQTKAAGTAKADTAKVDTANADANKTDTDSVQQKTVRVGYYDIAGFQEYDEKTKTYSGYSYEFLMALQQYTNWKYKFVPCTFAESLTMLKNGQIDLVNNVSMTPEREKIYEFSSLNSGENTAYLAMKAGDTRVALNDYEEMNNIKIGLAKDSIYSERLITFFKKMSIEPRITWYESQSEVQDAFDTGKVDAHIITSSKKNAEHIILSFSPDAYYIATTKGNKELIDEVDIAIESLHANDPYFELHLQEKYYGKATENYTVLTKDEQQYIIDNPVAKVIYQTDWYPLSYRDKEGEFAGAIRGVYDLLEQRTGLKFEYVPTDEVEETDNIAEDSGCQMIAEQPTDYSGAALYDVKLSKSFITPPLTEVSNKLVKPGATIALVDGDYLSDVCKRLYGEEYKYTYCDSVEACIEKVKDKKADATVLISYESEFYRQQRVYSSLSYHIVDEGSYSLSVAVFNNADPRLYSIIEKGLNSIATGEITNIFNETLVSVQKDDFLTIIYDHPIPTIISLATLIALIIGMTLGWIFIRKLKRQNEIIHRQNGELLRANQATTNFFSRMSHDMRTPMNGILGVARLSREESDTKTLKGNMAQIENSGEYLLSLINDTLDFQRIESGKLELQKEIVNCDEILTNIVKMIMPGIKKKNLTLQTNNRNVILDCYIFVDPVRMKQIFLNLISNAIKFTPEGGTISVEYECKERVGMISKDRFYIRDTGIGMSKEFMDERMFQPFAQEQNEVTGQYAGSGLGLSIVKSLVDLMGGSIQVESEVGVGTTFILDLDFERVDEAQAKKQLSDKDRRREDAGRNLKDKRILLVEDHPLNAEISKRLLERVGCQVEWAKNGQESVDAFVDAKERYYDAILMDIRMPLMNGLEAATIIRSLKRLDAKTIPIIAMTANAYEEDIQKSLNAGMNAHLAKPINPEEMYEAIAKLVK